MFNITCNHFFFLKNPQKVAWYLLIFHFDQFLGVHIWSGQRQDGDRALHTVVLSQFTERWRKWRENISIYLSCLLHVCTRSRFHSSRTWSSPVCTALCSFHSGRRRLRLWGRACGNESACSSVSQSHSAIGFPLRKEIHIINFIDPVKTCKIFQFTFRLNKAEQTWNIWVCIPSTIPQGYSLPLTLCPRASTTVLLPITANGVHSCRRRSEERLLFQPLSAPRKLSEHAGTHWQSYTRSQKTPELLKTTVTLFVETGKRLLAVYFLCTDFLSWSVSSCSKPASISPEPLLHFHLKGK